MNPTSDWSVTEEPTPDKDDYNPQVDEMQDVNNWDIEDEDNS